MSESNTPAVAQGRELRSLISQGGEVILSLEAVEYTAPAAHEVLVRMEAAPINPSDGILLPGPADLSRARVEENAQGPVIKAPVPADYRAAVASRVGLSLPVGNEGAGTVVEAGADCQHLKGKKVALFGGGMYADYRKIDAASCLELPDDASAEEGASSFVNPLTALSMVETMRMEGHQALILTAAAANLGQMLNKICLQDGVPLVNIVRKEAQVQLLKDLGARYVCNSSHDNFMDELTDAVEQTGARLAFDAVGGGELASQILQAMEAAAKRQESGFSPYGSSQHKQVYIYGGLDRSPTVIDRSIGMAWSVGGWLLPTFMAKAGPDVVQRMKQRVRDELKTTFASHYTQRISLQDALDPKRIAAYSQHATGEKYLIEPQAR